MKNGSIEGDVNHSSRGGAERGVIPLPQDAASSDLDSHSLTTPPSPTPQEDAK